jgi:hypothetical protein
VEQLNQDVPNLIKAFEQDGKDALNKILRCASQSLHLKTAVLCPGQAFKNDQIPPIAAL